MIRARGLLSPTRAASSLPRVSSDLGTDLNLGLGAGAGFSLGGASEAAWPGAALLSATGLASLTLISFVETAPSSGTAASSTAASSTAASDKTAPGATGSGTTASGASDFGRASMISTAGALASAEGVGVSGFGSAASTGTFSCTSMRPTRSTAPSRPRTATVQSPLAEISMPTMGKGPCTGAISTARRCWVRKRRASRSPRSLSSRRTSASTVGSRRRSKHCSAISRSKGSYSGRVNLPSAARTRLRACLGSKVMTVESTRSFWACRRAINLCPCN